LYKYVPFGNNFKIMFIEHVNFWETQDEVFNLGMKKKLI
jgi:hypothetical protein